MPLEALIQRGGSEISGGRESWRVCDLEIPPCPDISEVRAGAGSSSCCPKTTALESFCFVFWSGNDSS